MAHNFSFFIHFVLRGMNKKIDSNKHLFLSAIAFWCAETINKAPNYIFAAETDNEKFTRRQKAARVERRAGRRAGGKENAFNDQTKMKNFFFALFASNKQFFCFITMLKVHFITFLCQWRAFSIISFATTNRFQL